MSVARTHPILSSRAVHPPWTDRYVRFKRGDWEAFKAARHTHHHGWMKRAFVDACGGFVIHRSDPNGARLPSYIRPDKAICTWHGRKSVQRRGSKAICGICGGDLSKYTQASKRTTARSGKLIDVHPLLGERLQAGDEPIYFCLEGCVKADAVAGTGGLSISVLSVTLWQADEEPTHWALWLPILQRAPVVYVIPDSDYQPKPAWGAYEPGALPRYSKGGEVRYSTDRCVHWLRRYHSVNARFLVPPYLDRATAARSKVDNRFKIGIDDHIALGGNLSKWDIHSNPRGVHSWVYERSRYRNLPKLPQRDSRQRRERDNRFLDWLEDFAGLEGYYSPKQLQNDLDWSSRTAWKAKASCIKRGVLNVWDGDPRGEGNGNDPHLYRFTIRDEL
jgi:hypothetical protein